MVPMEGFNISTCQCFRRYTVECTQLVFLLFVLDILLNPTTPLFLHHYLGSCYLYGVEDTL